jgi:putative glycosyltransferase (TIGR04372 family)
MNFFFKTDLSQVKKNTIVFRITTKIQKDGIFSFINALLIKVFNITFGRLISFILLPLCLAFNVKFLNVFSSRIGHLCCELDCYIKEEVIGGHPKYTAIVLAPRGLVANEHILLYWKPYVKFIRSPLLCLLLNNLSNNRFTKFNVYRYACPIDDGADFPNILKMYEKSGGLPLLSLNDFDYQRGQAILFKYGMPRDAWFVCVHCREESYISGEEQLYRNADITNYLPAMEAIVERGGWIIRMGDPGMTKIQTTKHIIDYAHSDILSEWMDVFLCATCKFFLGSASGLHALSSVFGIPSAIANHAPTSVSFSYLPKDIGIPKLMYSQSESRYLSFSEIFGSPLGNFRHDRLYEQAKVSAVENTSEDIKALAIEMLDRVDGKAVYSTQENLNQDHIKSLMNPSHYSYGSESRIGREFVRKYSFLLSD